MHSHNQHTRDNLDDSHTRTCGLSVRFPPNSRSAIHVESMVPSRCCIWRWPRVAGARCCAAPQWVYSSHCCSAQNIARSMGSQKGNQELSRIDPECSVPKMFSHPWFHVMCPESLPISKEQNTTSSFNELLRKAFLIAATSYTILFDQGLQNGPDN